VAASRELQAFLSSDGVVAALDRHYARVIERILQELAAGISRPGASRARDLLITLRDLVAQLDPKKDSFVRTWIRERLPQAFILGDKSAVRQVREELEKVTAEKRALVGDLNRSFTAVNTLALRAIVAAMEDRLVDAARQVLTTSSFAIRRTQLILHQDQAVREAVTGGIIRGAAGREISDDIARIILTGEADREALQRLRARGFQSDSIALYKRLSEGQFIKVGDRNFNVRAYANLVARTMPREAHRVGTVVRLQQNGIDHVRISQHKQVEIDECTPFAGRVYYIGPLPQDPLGFPHLKQVTNGGPPWHPHCIHVVEPFVAVLKPQSAIDAARADAELLPRRFLGKTAAEVRDLVHALDENELKAIAPKGMGDIKPAA
jgi:hypothetical protein